MSQRLWKLPLICCSLLFVVGCGNGANRNSEPTSPELGNRSPNQPAFRLTAETVDVADVTDQRCRAVFGSGARVADWSDVQAHHSAGRSADAVLPRSEVAWIRYNGTFSATSGFRYPFLARFPVHAGFAVFDDIGGVFALGTWSGPYRLLCLA